MKPSVLMTAARTNLSHASEEIGANQRLISTRDARWVPTGSQDGTRLGKLARVDHVRIPHAGRVEFIMTTPSPDVAVGADDPRRAA